MPDPCLACVVPTADAGSPTHGGVRPASVFTAGCGCNATGGSGAIALLIALRLARMQRRR